MSFSKPCYPEDRAARYELILAQAVSLLDEALNPIANLANMAALLADALPRINWCGFYLLDGGMLTLGPFCGLPGKARFSASPMCTPFPAISPATAHPEARSSSRFTIRGASSAFWISTVLIPRALTSWTSDIWFSSQRIYKPSAGLSVQPTPCNKRVEATSPPNISTPAIIRIFTHSKKKPTVGLYACRRFLLFIRLSPWPPIRGRSSPQLRNRRCSPSDIDTWLSPRHSHSPSRRCAPHIPACSGRSPRRPSP